MMRIIYDSVQYEYDGDALMCTVTLVYLVAGDRRDMIERDRRTKHGIIQNHHLASLRKRFAQHYTCESIDSSKSCYLGNRRKPRRMLGIVGSSPHWMELCE